MVESTIRDGIARIFLNRPGKSNALDTALLDALLGALKKVRASEGVRAVVLGGNGKSFCGGADIHELARLTPPSARRFIRRIHACCDALRSLPVPVVARLHGAVIGAGLELAASCDLRVAAEGTRFAMPEVKLGIPSVVEAALLPRLVGAGRAAWLVLTGDAIDARTALEWGLVEELAPPQALDDGVGRLLGRLVANDPAALAAQKRLLRLWAEAPLATSVAESIRAFGRATISRGKRHKEH